MVGLSFLHVARIAVPPCSPTFGSVQARWHPPCPSSKSKLARVPLSINSGTGPLAPAPSSNHPHCTFHSLGDLPLRKPSLSLAPLFISTSGCDLTLFLRDFWGLLDLLKGVLKTDSHASEGIPASWMSRFCSRSAVCNVRVGALSSVVRRNNRSWSAELQRERPRSLCGSSLPGPCHSRDGHPACTHAACLKFELMRASALAVGFWPRFGGRVFSDVACMFTRPRSHLQSTIFVTSVLASKPLPNGIARCEVVTSGSHQVAISIAFSNVSWK